MAKTTTLIPAQNALCCASCGRDWSTAFGLRESDESAVDAMWTWKTDGSKPLGGRVVACQLVCQGDCDREVADTASMNLRHFAGPDAAWSGVEEMLGGYEWPAALRRKLLAFLRDASRLDPSAGRGRTAA